MQLRIATESCIYFFSSTIRRKRTRSLSLERQKPYRLILLLVGHALLGLLGSSTASAKSGDAVPVIWERPSSPVVGDNFGCAISGIYPYQANCWGSNDSGQLGNPTRRYHDGTTYGVRVLTADGPLADVRWLAAGYRHACALRGDGTVWCWGAGNRGQLGFATASSPVAVPVAGITTAGAIYSSAQSSFTCAILGGGSAKCWGANESGQLGNGTRATAQAEPVTVALSDIESMALGQSFTCATHGAFFHDSLACWGNNALGQLGNFTYTLSATPVDVYSLTYQTALDSLTAGAFHVCVMRYDAASGTLEPFCWGDNSHGQLGNPLFTGGTNYPVPVLNASLSGYLLSTNNLFAGALHTCANIWPSTGELYGTCWGDNSFGELGDGTTSPEAHPTSWQIGSFIEAAGGHQTCGNFLDGSVTCWGRNSQGQLGDGTLVDKTAVGSRIMIDDEIFGSGMDE